MNKKLKNLIFSITLVVFSVVSLLPNYAASAYAQNIREGPWFSPGFGNYVEKVWDSEDSEIFGERYTYAQVHWIIYGIISFLIPNGIEQCVVDISTDETFLGLEVPDIDAIGSCGADLLLPGDWFAAAPETGTNPHLASAMYSQMKTNPISGVGYLADKAEELKLVEEVNAQNVEGFGFGSLTPIQEVWQAARDVSYFLLVLIAIVLAFMIMFRTKTSPQTVITVQSAIPKLVIALILITFSYAIAGFLVDLAYVIVGLFAVMLHIPGNIFDGTTAVETFNTAVSGTDAYLSILAGTLLYTVLFVVMGVVATTMGFLLGPFAPFVQLGAGITALLLLLFLLGLFVIYFKIIWMLLKATVQVALLTVAGPFYILMGVLPGGAGIGSWIRTILAQIMIFPTTIIMMFFAHFLFWRLRSTTVIGDIFGQLPFLNPYRLEQAAVTGDLILPGFQIGMGLFGLVGSIMVLFLVPHAANIIKSIVSGQPFGYGSAIGQSFFGVAAPGRWMGGQAWGAGSRYASTEIGMAASGARAAKGVRGSMARMITGAMERRGNIIRRGGGNKGFRRPGEG